jgi:acyl-homoserine lactone acylase PvdQ
MRLLDFPSEVRRIWPQIEESKKKLLGYYSDGVNEGFKIGQNSREFKDLDYLPDPWNPQDSILLLILQSFDQTRKTFYRDYEEELQKEKWGKMTEALFDSEDAPWSNTILKDGEYEKKMRLLRQLMLLKNPLNYGHNFHLYLVLSLVLIIGS